MVKTFRFATLALTLLAMVMSACAPATPEPQHAARPGAPVYSQTIFDCNTGQYADSAAFIQPDDGCDNWQINRYERPFNAESQDTFFPDLDILSAELGSDGNWFYARLSLFAVSSVTSLLDGTYAVEFDLDLDGRGDVLVMATQPGEEAASDWSVAGVQFYGDSNNDVGNQVPLAPDPPSQSDGYDTLTFDQGQGEDPDLAWVRWQSGQPAHLEIAVKASALYYSPSFKWWAWSDQGVDDPGEADYHDTFDHPEAGDPIQGQTYFPSKAINELDNTCASIWGAPPSDDPELCVNDPSVEPPVTEGSPTPEDTASPTATPTLPTVTATPTLPDITATPTPTTNTTSTVTPTPSPTVCFSYDQTGQLIDCTPTPTPSPTPTDCYNQYPFANVPCTPTPSYTPSATPTTCYSRVTDTPTTTADPNGIAGIPGDTATPTNTADPNGIAGIPTNGLVPCTPTPSMTPTATLCVSGGTFAALVVCSPTPTATQCVVSDNNATTVIICSPTPTPTLCVTMDASTGQQMPCPTPQTAAMMVYPQKNTNCRQAPDSTSQAYDTLMQGEGYVPLGRTPDNLYMLFRGPVTGVRCWAAAFLFDIPFGPLNQVPGAVLPYINYPTATPTEKPSSSGGGAGSAPTATPTCPPKGVTGAPAGCP